MALVLRIDVDKPYGRANIIEKVLSKICENYWLPAISSIGYLKHLKKFLAFLSEERIQSHIYFRKCTLPPKEWLNESLMEGHLFGHHAENTRNIESFKNELEEAQEYFFPERISSFTKHGSGEWKSGRNHYPVYEPDKYLNWAETTGVPFLFGNGEALRPDHLIQESCFHPNMFWIDRYDRETEIISLEEIVEIAKENNVVVIIHPSNYIADQKVKDYMKELIHLAHQCGISWITIDKS